MPELTPTAQIQRVCAHLPRSAPPPHELVAAACGVRRSTAYRWLAMDPADPRPTHRTQPPTQEHANRVAAAAAPYYAAAGAVNPQS